MSQKTVHAEKEENKAESLKCRECINAAVFLMGCYSPGWSESWHACATHGAIRDWCNGACGEWGELLEDNE